MATDCLVKKFKSVVNNDNLKVLGRLVFKVAANITTGNSRRITFSAVSGKTIKLTLDSLSEDVYFTNEAGTSNFGKTIEISSGYTWIYNATSNIINLLVDDKYNIRVMADGNNFFMNAIAATYIDVQDIKYIDGLTDFGGNNNTMFLNGNIDELNRLSLVGLRTGGYAASENLNCYGTTHGLSSITTLKYLYLRYIRFTGDIKYLGSCKELRNLQILNASKNSSLYGSYEELCESFIANGKTTSIESEITNSGVTLNGTAYGSKVTITFSGSTCQISRNGSAVASYDGSTWTYA